MNNEVDNSKRKTGKKIIRWVKNKYLISFLFFLVWMTFFDQHNLLSQRKYKSQLVRLEQSISHYKSEIISSKEEVLQLTTDVKNLERYAREKFFMKKPDEHIYVIVEE